jgi:hypothetical protein
MLPVKMKSYYRCKLLPEWTSHDEKRLSEVHELPREGTGDNWFDDVDFGWRSTSSAAIRPTIS